MSGDLVLRTPGERFSLRTQRRTLAVLLVLAGALAISALGALCLGSRATPPAAVLAALGSDDGGALAFIVESVRLPRVLLALLVGAALAVSGTVFQALVRNPLASPDVIGITSGAAAAAVLYMTLAGPGAPSAWVPFAALAGAGLVAALIVLLAWRGGVTTVRLVLIGIGMAAASGAVTTLLIILNPETTALSAYRWLTGSLYAAQWRDVQGMLPWLAVFLPLLLFCARHMNALALGDEAARGVGVPVGATRYVLLGASVALAGSAVAHAGGLAFVGLIAPHIARALMRAGFAGLLMASAFIGALIVLVADTVGRVMFLPHDLPAGVFVSGVGAVFFVVLLHRLRRS